MKRLIPERRGPWTSSTRLTSTQHLLRRCRGAARLRACSGAGNTYARLLGQCARQLLPQHVSTSISSNVSPEEEASDGQSRTSPVASDVPLWKTDPPPLTYTVPYIGMLDERGNVRRGFVDEQAFERMAEEAAKEGLWLRALIEVAYKYGWRRGELINLRAQQVDLTDRILRLEPDTTKNREGREVWMDDVVCALLGALIQNKRPDDHVFTRPGGRPVRDFRTAWQNLCIRAGVIGPDGKPSRFECNKCKVSIEAGTSRCRACGGRRHYSGLIIHDMRRSAARRLLNAGNDVIDVMKNGWVEGNVHGKSIRNL